MRASARLIFSSTARRRVARALGAAAMVLALALAAIAAPAQQGEVRGFGYLAKALRGMPEFRDAQVLGVELIRLAEDDGAGGAEDGDAVWVVEFLTPDDSVELAIFDARTLAERRITRRVLDALEGRPERDEPFDVFPLYLILEGSDANEVIEGDWSNDISTGNAGRDLFVLTPGEDVILDFDPAEDAIDAGDFARREFGFSVLRSMADVESLSIEDEALDRPALIIDVDGDFGDWTTALIGVELDDLSPENLILGDHAAQPLPFAVVGEPARTAVMSDGSILTVDAFDFGAEEPPPRLVRGRERTLQWLLDQDWEAE